MDIVKNKFSIQGVDLIRLTQEFGTPVYVYDADKIKAQYEYLKGSFPGVDLQVKYAMKALNNISILKYIKKLGAGLDAVSIQEVKLGLRAGFDPKEIIYTPSSVGFDEIEAAVD